jgi:SAM-dependent methyltransferase
MIDVPPPDPRVYAVLAAAGLGPDLFNPRQHRSCELVDRYALAHAVALLDALGLRPLLAAPRTADELFATRGFADAFRRPLAWLLRYLAHAGVLEAGPRGYRLAAPAALPALAALRAAVLEGDPAYAPALALLDEAAAIYPRVARGETSGERALFLRARLWADYFDNANGYYGLTNRVAGRAAAAGLPAGARVLEVGAGLGSATAALLEALAARGAVGALGVYRATEPVVFFRRRAERTLPPAHPGVPLVFDALDLDRPWAAQGVVAGAWDLVYGVNVFHLARDLDAALREARAALAPGGRLVIGEGLRPGPEVPVAAEMPFQLLASFADVRIDPTTRPTAGFLTAEAWLAACARAGFADATLVPDAIRLRALVPAFLAAAVVGRAPGG